VTVHCWKNDENGIRAFKKPPFLYQQDYVYILLQIFDSFKKWSHSYLQHCQKAVETQVPYSKRPEELFNCFDRWHHGTYLRNVQVQLLLNHVCKASPHDNQTNSY